MIKVNHFNPNLIIAVQRDLIGDFIINVMYFLVFLLDYIVFGFKNGSLIMKYELFYHGKVHARSLTSFMSSDEDNRY